MTTWTCYLNEMEGLEIVVGDAVSIEGDSSYGLEAVGDGWQWCCCTVVSSGASGCGVEENTGSDVGDRGEVRQLVRLHVCLHHMFVL